jgi:hypothetical protein
VRYQVSHQNKKKICPYILIFIFLDIKLEDRVVLFCTQ